MTTSATIYAAAKKDLGLKETPGAACTPRIATAIRAAADWLAVSDEKTFWCGCIRGLWGLETGSGVPPAHYRAASWAKWGKAVPLDKPALWQQGDTIIMERIGGNHVTLLDRVRGDYAYCLGGNQSDAVTISRFALDRITSVRR